MILFDSDSDKGEEVLVTLLAKKAAIVTVDNMIKAQMACYTKLEGYYTQSLNYKELIKIREELLNL